MPYIKDLIHMERFDPAKLNIVWGGCGTGKTTWAIEELPGLLGIEPKDAIFVTSRAITAEQLRAKLDGQTELEPIPEPESISIDEECSDVLAELRKDRIHIFTMSTFGDALGWLSSVELDPLLDTKLVIIDEIHALFTDATFMKSVKAIIGYMNIMVKKLHTPVVGLTATPFFLAGTGFPFVLLNDATFQYHAWHTIVTEFKYVSRLVVERFTEGRTIIMCPDIKSCVELMRTIPDSFILVSKESDDFTDQMAWVRDYIVEHGDLPDTYPDGHGRHLPLKVLIGTSTLREGFNLSAASNVRHVVSCCNDATSIIQFAGRVRDDIKNLAIAYTFSHNNHSAKTLGYTRESIEQFRQFFTGDRSNGWPKTIAELRADPDEDIEFYETEPLTEARVDLEQRAAEVSEGLARRVEQQKAEAKKRKRQPKHRPNVGAFMAAINFAWREIHIIKGTEEAASFIKYAQNCHILPGKQDWEYNLVLVMAAVQKMGYKVESARKKIKGKLVRYYIIHNG